MLKRKTSLKRSSQPLKRNTSLKRGKLKKSSKSPERLEQEQKERDKLNVFWEYCWQQLPHKSMVSGRYLGGEMKKIFFHHVYEKNKNAYPELKFCLKNILVVTMEEHGNLNGDLEYYEQARIKRKYVMDNYELCVKEAEDWEQEYEKQINKEVYDV